MAGRATWLLLVLTGTVDVVISRALYYQTLRLLPMSIHTIILTLSPVVAIGVAAALWRISRRTGSDRRRHGAGWRLRRQPRQIEGCIPGLWYYPCIMDLFAPTWTPTHPAFVSLLNALSGETDPVYVVGGVVRDALLGRSAGLTDLDVIVTRAASEVAQRAADRLGWAYYTLDAERDVARLVFTAGKTPLVCDIAAMRGGELTTDLQARDFTVNAMAMRWRRDCASELVDLAGGQADLDERQLRRVTPWGWRRILCACCAPCALPCSSSLQLKKQRFYKFCASAA
ncbi:MAG: hypothetical protein IPM07_07640 [Anaerolineales bacterium]|nr:hypothetical protein [Anaerolineales bacterium]